MPTRFLPAGCVARRHVRCAPRTHPGNRGGGALGSPQGLGTAQRAASAAEARCRRCGRVGPAPRLYRAKPLRDPATSPPQPRAHRATAHGGRCASSQPGHAAAARIRGRGRSLYGAKPLRAPHDPTAAAAEAPGNGVVSRITWHRTHSHAAESVPMRLFARRLCRAAARAMCTPHASGKPWWQGAGEPARAWHCTASGRGHGDPLSFPGCTSCFCTCGWLSDPRCGWQRAVPPRVLGVERRNGNWDGNRRLFGGRTWWRVRCGPSKWLRVAREAALRHRPGASVPDAFEVLGPPAAAYRAPQRQHAVDVALFPMGAVRFIRSSTTDLFPLSTSPLPMGSPRVLVLGVPHLVHPLLEIRQLLWRLQVTGQRRRDAPASASASSGPSCFNWLSIRSSHAVSRRSASPKFRLPRSATYSAAWAKSRMRVRRRQWSAKKFSTVSAPSPIAACTAACSTPRRCTSTRASSSNRRASVNRAKYDAATARGASPALCGGSSPEMPHSLASIHPVPSRTGTMEPSFATWTGSGPGGASGRSAAMRSASSSSMASSVWPLVCVVRRTVSAPMPTPSSSSTSFIAETNGTCAPNRVTWPCSTGLIWPGRRPSSSSRGEKTEAACRASAVPTPQLHVAAPRDQHLALPHSSGRPHCRQHGRSSPGRVASLRSTKPSICRTRVRANRASTTASNSFHVAFGWPSRHVSSARSSSRSISAHRSCTLVVSIRTPNNALARVGQLPTPGQRSTAAYGVSYRPHAHQCKNMRCTRLTALFQCGSVRCRLAW